MEPAANKAAEADGDVHKLINYSTKVQLFSLAISSPRITA